MKLSEMNNSRYTRVNSIKHGSKILLNGYCQMLHKKQKKPNK